MTPMREHNNCLATHSKEHNIDEISDKELERTIIKKIKESQKNTGSWTKLGRSLMCDWKNRQGSLKNDQTEALEIKSLTSLCLAKDVRFLTSVNAMSTTMRNT